MKSTIWGKRNPEILQLSILTMTKQWLAKSRKETKRQNKRKLPTWSTSTTDLTDDTGTTTMWPKLWTQVCHQFMELQNIIRSTSESKPGKAGKTLLSNVAAKSRKCLESGGKIWIGPIFKIHFCHGCQFVKPNASCIKDEAASISLPLLFILPWKAAVRMNSHLLLHPVRTSASSVHWRALCAG